MSASEQFREFVGIEGEPDQELGLENAKEKKGKGGKPIDVEAREQPDPERTTVVETTPAKKKAAVQEQRAENKKETTAKKAAAKQDAPAKKATAKKK